MMVSPLVCLTFECAAIETSANSADATMPPYSSSKRIPKISFSRNSSTTSHGNSALLSISAARGAMRSRASSRTRSRISRCSSVSGSTGTPRRLVARPLVPVVADSLDVVAVGVEHVRAVVTGVILGPLTGRPVVVVAGRERDAVELVDACVVGSGEGDVHVRRRLALDEPKTVATHAEAGDRFFLVH